MVASAVIGALIGALVVAKRVKKVVFMNYNHGYPLLSQRGPVSVLRGIVSILISCICVNFSEYRAYAAGMWVKGID